jgi:peptide/nickel transport system substrate-binding protein
MKGFKALLLVSAAFCAGFASGPVAAENVLRWASGGGAATIDPHGYDEGPTFAQLSQVYEGLIGVDSNLALAPRLTVAWRLVDPITWEFELRQNVRFHDGTPLTADDVVFSIGRAKADLPGGFAGPLAGRIESIAEVRAVDERTVHIETKFPDPQLWDKVRPIYIMSKGWAEAHDARAPVDVTMAQENYASRHANGTGPFVLKEFEPNGRAVMVRNPDWWGLERYPHNLDRIEYSPIGDPAERLAALLRGDLHLLTNPPFATLDRIRSTPGLKLAQAPDLRTIWLGLDLARGELRSSNVKGRNPFSDRRVRRAIYQAIDIEAIRKDVMRGLALPAGMLVSPGAIGYAPELDNRLPYDPEAAKTLLAEAGYSQGFGVTLDCPNNSHLINDEAICRVIAAQLNEVGIAAAANPQPKQIYWSKFDNRESDFWFDTWFTLDSHFIFVHQYRTGDSANASGYSNPRVDALIEKIDREMVTYARDAMIEEVWKIVLDDIVYVPLHHQVQVWAMHDYLDIPVYPVGFPLFREARLKLAKVD